MAVNGEGCEVDPADERCVQSIGVTNKKGGPNYENDQKCTITNPPAVPISVETFAVEGAYKGKCYDFLTVNGALYCGTEGPEGIVPDGSPIEWISDKGDTEAGWKICFPATLLGLVE
eukprot:scaffold55166_cov45-Phaeocystis_antarctica.AAC.1